MTDHQDERWSPARHPYANRSLTGLVGFVVGCALATDAKRSIGPRNKYTLGRSLGGSVDDRR